MINSNLKGQNMLKKVITTGLSTLLAFSAFASDLVFDTEVPLIWQPVITLSGGPAWTTPGQNQYIYPVLPFSQINYYQYNSPSSTIATGEIFFGLQRIVYPGITGELGIGLAAASDAQVTGVVTVNGFPNISTYEYKVDHGRAELKGKLLSNLYWLKPYISGSFGAGWNNSHDFRATTVNPVFFPAPWFANQTNIAFSYTLGIGVQAMLNRNWQVGVGYEFADWGKSATGVDAYTLLPGPFLTHLYTNELLFSVSFLF